MCEREQMGQEGRIGPGRLEVYFLGGRDFDDDKKTIGERH